MRSKAQKPNCPPKPPDLAQRVRSLMAQSFDDQRAFTQGQKADVTQPMCFLPSPDSPPLTDKPQDPNKTISRSFEDLDIPFIDEEEEEEDPS